MSDSSREPLSGPLILWRISNHRDLTGLGGELGDGRWHTAERGRRIVYLSENPATALLETLANLKGNPALFSESYQLLKIEVPPSVSLLSCPTLGPHWQSALAATQAIGNQWLSARQSALLAVPSAPAPESTNYLLHPLHPDAASVRIVTAQRISFDKRLFHIAPALL